MTYCRRTIITQVRVYNYYGLERRTDLCVDIIEFILQRGELLVRDWCAVVRHSNAVEPMLNNAVDVNVSDGGLGYFHSRKYDDLEKRGVA